MRRRLAILTAVTAVIGVSVGAVGLAALTGKTSRGPQTVTIPEGYTYPVDIRSGDTVNLIMNPDGGQQKRCDDAGGQLSRNRHTLIYTCAEVDF